LWEKKPGLVGSTQSPGFALDQGAGSGRVRWTAVHGTTLLVSLCSSSLNSACAAVPHVLLLLVAARRRGKFFATRSLLFSSNMYLSSLSDKFSWWFLCSEQLFRRLEGGTEGVLEIRPPIQPFWRYGMEDWCMSICFFSSSFVSFELHFVSVSSWVLDRLIESTALRASSIFLQVFAEKSGFIVVVFVVFLRRCRRLFEVCYNFWKSKGVIHNWNPIELFRPYFNVLCFVNRFSGLDSATSSHYLYTIFVLD
jgi:hypothetical protein